MLIRIKIKIKFFTLVYCLENILYLFIIQAKNYFNSIKDDSIVKSQFFANKQYIVIARNGATKQSVVRSGSVNTEIG